MSNNNYSQDRKLLLLVLTVVMTVMVVACSDKSSGSKSSISNGNEIAVLNETKASDKEDAGSFQAVLLEIDTDKQYVVLQKVSSVTRAQYSYTGGTDISNRYGDIISASQLTVGEVMDVEISQDNGKITSMKASADDFNYNDITGFNLDTDKKSITVGSEEYFYDENTVFAKGDDLITADQLDSVDEITLKGKDKQLDSVIVNNGHGYVKLTSTTFFDGGYIELGDKILKVITDDMRFAVPCGTYTMTVSKDVTSGTSEITIKDNEETTVDLLQFQSEAVRLGTLAFDIKPEGAKLTIDGVSKDYSQMVDAAYGAHKIEVSADGYNTYTQVINVDSTYEEYKIALVESEDSSESSTDSSDGQSETTTGTSETTAASSSKSSTKATTSTSETTTSQTIDYSSLISSLLG